VNRPGEAIDLSLVVPVYNERENLEPLVGELLEVLADAQALEILLVDDGSRDGSAELAAELADRHPEIRPLRLRENRGQTAAFDAGFRAARGRRIVTLDADLQNDPRDIPGLLSALDEYDAAVGYRRKRRDSWLRRLSSRIANGVRNRLSGDDIIDTGCSLKAFRRECVEGLKLFTGMHRFLPTLLRMEGRRVVQLPVNHRPRTRGRSKYGMRNRAVRAFVDLLAVRWMKKRRLNYEVIRDEP
jgi:glycosyltransferase involved in cell wall biosynthesis